MNVDAQALDAALIAERFPPTFGGILEGRYLKVRLSPFGVQRIQAGSYPETIADACMMGEVVEDREVTPLTQRYHIVAANDLQELEDMVNAHLRLGWKVQGGVCIAGAMCCQAISGTPEPKENHE